jgi:hypothetical protein
MARTEAMPLECARSRTEVRRLFAANEGIRHGSVEPTKSAISDMRRHQSSEDCFDVLKVNETGCLVRLKARMKTGRRGLRSRVEVFAPRDSAT